MCGSVSKNGNFEKKLFKLEIDLRPLKFSPKFTPYFLSENLRPLKNHSGRVFPINNVDPLSVQSIMKLLKWIFALM